MWRTLRITEKDWLQTPLAVQSKLLGAHMEAHSLKLRSVSHRQQINLLNEPDAQIKLLVEKINSQQKQILRLQNKLAQTDALAAQVVRLTAEIAHLKEKLGQNSRNSSLPPSTDSPFKKKFPKSELSRLKQGAQKGHQGFGGTLRPVDEVHQFIELRPEACARCGSLLLGADSNPARRQMIEITDSGTKLIEYRRHALRCLSCRKINRAAWSDEAQSGAFGAKTVAVVGYLTGRLNISQRDTMEAMQELFGVRMAVSSICALQRRLSRALADKVAEIHRAVQQEDVCCVDETSWKEKDKLSWLRVAASSDATIFQITAGRGLADANEIIGNSKNLIITTDRYPVYNRVPVHQRQICWAHLKRDFQALSERAGESKIIGEKLLEHTDELFELWRRVRDGTLSFSDFQQLVEPLREQVKCLLIESLTADNAKTRRTCGNILKLKSSLWTFTRQAGVEPTNNQAERALRRAVLWRRKSFGTQSAEGSRFVERILTVVTTLRQQRRSVLAYLEDACVRKNNFLLNFTKNY